MTYDFFFFFQNMFIYLLLKSAVYNVYTVSSTLVFHFEHNCVSTYFMPAQCITWQPKMAVRTTADRIHGLLLLLFPPLHLSWPISVPQGKRYRARGVGYSKMRPRVSLVVQAFTTGGQC